MNQLLSILYVIFCFATAMIGYEIHHNLLYSIVDFFLAPLAWGYWLIFHDVNLTVIKQTFTFFLT